MTAIKASFVLLRARVIWMLPLSVLQAHMLYVIVDFGRVRMTNFRLQGEIMSCKFDPTGQNIAACSTDRGICTSQYSTPILAATLTDYIFSALANIRTEHKLRFTLQPRQSAHPRPAMVPLLLSHLYRGGRPYADYDGRHYWPEDTKNSRASRDCQHSRQDDGQRVRN